MSAVSAEYLRLEPCKEFIVLLQPFPKKYCQCRCVSAVEPIRVESPEQPAVVQKEGADGASLGDDMCRHEWSGETFVRERSLVGQAECSQEPIDIGAAFMTAQADRRKALMGVMCPTAEVHAGIPDLSLQDLTTLAGTCCPEFRFPPVMIWGASPVAVYPRQERKEEWRPMF